MHIQEEATAIDVILLAASSPSACKKSESQVALRRIRIVQDLRSLALVLFAGLLLAACGLCQARAANKIYWSSGLQINRADLSGANATTLVSQLAHRVALDVSRGKIESVPIVVEGFGAAA